MHIVVDVRKAQDSGIGTYIRSVVPGVIAGLEGRSFTVLTVDGQMPLLLEPSARCAIRVVSAGPLTLAEQWRLPAMLRRIAPFDYFWATSLAHPMIGTPPLIATVHDVVQLAVPGFSVARRIASALYLKNLRRHARLLLFNSRFTQDDFARRVGTPTAMQAVTPLGVDAKEWCLPATRAGARPYFITISSLRPHKNLACVLKAHAAVAERTGVDLIVVSSETADELACSSRVQWYRALPHARLHSLVANARGMILPSIYEGFGLPALEAMAAGCPVIASDIEAFREVCGDAARYFDPLRVDDLESALVRAASQSDAELALWRQRGHARVALFPWQATIASTTAAIGALD